MCKYMTLYSVHIFTCSTECTLLRTGLTLSLYLHVWPLTVTLSLSLSLPSHFPSSLLDRHIAISSPGANSPIDWVEENIVSLVPDLSPERAKILLGLNFYGYDFTSSTMDGNKKFAQWDTYVHVHTVDLEIFIVKIFSWSIEATKIKITKLKHMRML